MKEVDDTPLPESESEMERILKWSTYREIIERLAVLEKEVALLLEQRVTVRAPEATDDPEWF